MDHDKALAILKSLADGIDPASGKAFADGTYQHPDTVRALYFAVQTLERPASTPPVAATSESRSRSTTPSKTQFQNAGRPWSDEEEAQLGEAFDAGKSVLELSVEHQRSRVAIEARLVKLGKISAPQSGAMRYPIKGRSNAQNGVSESAPF